MKLAGLVEGQVKVKEEVVMGTVSGSLVRSLNVMETWAVHM